MKHNYLLIALAFLFICSVAAQDKPSVSVKDTAVLVKGKKKTIIAERRWGDAGFGLGLDYGGFVGAKVTFYPISYLGVFAAGGWEIVNVGWNVGAIGRLFPADGRHGVRPYLKIMYGVNGATKVTDNLSSSYRSKYDKMFFGFTAGVGLEVRFGARKKSGLNVDLNVPFRSPRFYSQISLMKKDPKLEITQEPLPVAISLGFHTEF